ncbi:hypothetical protein BX600DRAFT_517900 [Xylariales sp. PMI_506]|nr:hypothetical protein BX600DRAFT_517900 [Xylariales sp. PMI_506]
MTTENEESAVNRRWDFGDLLQSGMFADATILCENWTWRVHKCILTARSVYFQKESTTSEGELGGMDSEHIGWVIDYLYIGELPESVTTEFSFENFIAVFELAGCFDIENMMTDLTQILDNELQKIARYILAKMVCARDRRNIVVSVHPFIAQGKVEGFFTIASNAYTPEYPAFHVLRETLKKFVIATKFRILLHKDFKSVVEQAPGLILDLLPEMIPKVIGIVPVVPRAQA